MIGLINVNHALQEDTQKIRNNCLLQMMKIESATSLSMNVLWDSGSTLSLITFKEAAHLNIEGRKCTGALRHSTGVFEVIFPM